MQQTTIWQVYTTAVNVCCLYLYTDVVGRMLFTISAVRCSSVDCLVIALNVNGRILLRYVDAVVHSLSDSLFWSSCILTSRNNYCPITHWEKNTRRMYTPQAYIFLELERIFDFWWKRNILGRVLAAVNLFLFGAHRGVNEMVAG